MGEKEAEERRDPPNELERERDRIPQYVTLTLTLSAKRS